MLRFHFASNQRANAESSAENTKRSPAPTCRYRPRASAYSSSTTLCSTLRLKASTKRSKRSGSGASAAAISLRSPAVRNAPGTTTSWGM